LSRLVSVNKMYPPERGGMEVVAERIATHFAGIFDESVVVTFQPKERKRSEYTQDGVRVVRLPRDLHYEPLRCSFSYYGELSSLDGHDTTFLFHYPCFQPEIRALGRGYNGLLGKKIALFHLDISGLGPITPLYNRFVVQKFLDQMDRIVPTSQNLARTSQVLAGREERIRVIPLGVDTDVFVPAGHSLRPAIERSFAVSPGAGSKLVMYLGRFDWYKGLPYLVRAMKELPDRYVLALVGDGVEKQRVVREVNRLGLSERVAFFDHQPFELLPAFYSAADVFVLPSVYRTEAFGLVGIEAMACGTPTVTTELGTGTSSYIEDGVSGRIVKPRDPALLAEAILDICEHPDKYTRSIVRSQALAFSWASSFSRWHSLFKELGSL